MTMAYQQWYWDQMMRSQAQAGQGASQAQMQMQDHGQRQPMMQEHGQMGYQDMGYQGQMGYPGQGQIGYQAQGPIQPVHGQMGPGWNEGPLPPLPTGTKYDPLPMNQYGGVQPGYAHGHSALPQMGQVTGHMQGYPGR